MERDWSTEKEVQIIPSLSIPMAELHFRFSRSGGPGGQNVNKVNTKVTLLFEPANSASLTLQQKECIFNRLANRINQAGQLQIQASEYRTQQGNRNAAIDRFATLLRGALHTPKKRKKTVVSKKAKERRIKLKKTRSLLKRSRGRVAGEE
ncbi:alternative ribosome rescue aminoacyl-tRNA hydrolase ArfB [Desulfogranum japonicum]|uniref:alternative ribosome rescue aminoacyl-tRNA hydrolase ArfB n=1 Tax=Desulfogranum japonicum TaxID=231447 RepID=UPI000428873A|nr:alternative ribosome rescue aminoacyl-tRNA hydrolase ArfB [Desulfogranum japonicum]